jgi:hypothetical protein
VAAALAAGLIAWRAGGWKDAALQAKDAEIALLKEFTFERARDLLNALKDLHRTDLEAVEHEHRGAIQALQEAGLTPQHRAELEARVKDLELTTSRLGQISEEAGEATPRVSDLVEAVRSSSTFARSTRAWHRSTMARLYAAMLTRARKPGAWVAYSDVGRVIGLDMSNAADRDEIAELLGYVSKAEVAEGRPMLSSVVLHKDGSPPGQGFFMLAKELGRATVDEKDVIVHAREMKATHHTWAQGQEELGPATPGPA